MLNYIDNEKIFLGLIAPRLVLCCIIYRMINISLSALLVGLYSVVLYRQWSNFPVLLLFRWFYFILYWERSTYPRPCCSSAETNLYYMQSDQQFPFLIARHLLIYCVRYIMINISSASFLVGWYYVVLYTEWSTFPRLHSSLADNMLYYIENNWHFLGLIACQLIQVVLHREWSIFPRPYCSSADIIFYCIVNDQYFFGLITLPLVLYCIL